MPRLAAGAEEDPRGWLRPNPLLKASRSKQQQHGSTSSSSSSRRPHVAVERGLTATMCKPSEYQNMLTAVMHPHTRTGYKDSRDACNKTDRHNGGDYRRFESTYSKAFASVDERPIQFRRDGLPISARRVPGKPLMAPKLPSTSELTAAQRLCRRQNKVSVTIGTPGAAQDPCHFRSIYTLTLTAPHRALGQPNSGIAAEDAARGRRLLGLFA